MTLAEHHSNNQHCLGTPHARRSSRHDRSDSPWTAPVAASTEASQTFPRTGDMPQLYRSPRRIYTHLWRRTRGPHRATDHRGRAHQFRQLRRGATFVAPRRCVAPSQRLERHDIPSFFHPPPVAFCRRGAITPRPGSDRAKPLASNALLQPCNSVWRLPLSVTQMGQDRVIAPKTR
jgi:hypothetical protein